MNVRVFHDRRLDMIAALAILVGAVFGYGAFPEGGRDAGQKGEPPVPKEILIENDAPLPPVLEADVPILVYHHVRPAVGAAGTRPYEVTPEEFTAAMDLIAELGYTTVTVSDILDAFDGGASLPERPIVITFDDGRPGQYTHAFPILLKHGFIATIYPFTNAIGRENYLTWEQLEEMRDAGFEIGSHTRYHPYLTKAADDELAEELSVSKVALEERLGIAVRSVAWPFGLVDDRVIAAAVTAGYEGGRGLDHGRTQESPRRMDLNAYITTGSIVQLKAILGE
jgi:peptidoglycan/xylan/chitin deacetylase (PgdA/CDA1 family)